jgi:RNA polymerase sigma-70 factor (ECF subfamily)
MEDSLMARRGNTDNDLKQLAARDRVVAMDLVVERYRNRLVHHAFGIVKDQEMARDAVQEVFIKAMRETRFFDADFEIRAWLFRVTRNLCFNIVRDRRRRSGILANMPEESVPQARSRAVGDTVYVGEVRAELMTALKELTPNHREIPLLRYYGDLSYAEIALALEIRLGTVMSRLSRARTSLHRVLGEEHPLAEGLH